MASRGRDLERESFWRGVLTRQSASGLSVAAFCRREQLSQPSFYAWRRTLRERDGQRPKATRSRRPAQHFLPVRVTDLPPRESSITIELAEGPVLRLPEATPAVRIAELVRALQEASR
jgi:transposase-like protein